jgi:hypothetical protein
MAAESLQVMRETLGNIDDSRSMVPGMLGAYLDSVSSEIDMGDPYVHEFIYSASRLVKKPEDKGVTIIRWSFLEKLPILP